MFPPMELDGGAEYYLKPMNCPFHILIYKSRTRSYRELPLRMFEFGTVYRYEKSGRRARAHQGSRPDDGRRPHLHHEGADGGGARVAPHVRARSVARLRPRRLLPGTVDASRGQGGRRRGGVGGGDRGAATGGRGRWTSSSSWIEGGGAFYGPKISVQARDAIGRTWQMSTIQVDFQLPQRFDLHYAADDGERHRPIMIHRALFGSIERFFGVLTEHYAGAFPSWLAPEQLRFVPVADRHADRCHELAVAAASAGLRAHVDDSKESVGKKIRAAQLMKVPYTLVVGDQGARGRGPTRCGTDAGAETEGVAVRSHRRGARRGSPAAVARTDGLRDLTWPSRSGARGGCSTSRLPRRTGATRPASSARSETGPRPIGSWPASRSPTSCSTSSPTTPGTCSWCRHATSARSRTSPPRRTPRCSRCSSARSRR